MLSTRLISAGILAPIVVGVTLLLWNPAALAPMVADMRERKCPCGHTRGHPEVAQDAEYTLWGWIQLSMLGVTPHLTRQMQERVAAMQAGRS